MNRLFMVSMTIIVYTSTYGNIVHVVEARPSRSGIKVFADHAKTCLHLAEEVEGENTPEQKRLINEANRYCDLAKREFRILKIKYKQDNKVQKFLEKYRIDLLE